ncbi:MAG: hypothetical protein GY767_16640 [Shimia sp.]|nr:hypothetical protein [Shimia sp.]MCP4823052.1 hypothetical protein [Shimia sp.]
MPVTAQILPEISVVHVVCSGHVKAEETRKALLECYSDPAYRWGMPEVSDMTQAVSVDTGFEETMDFIKEFQVLHADNNSVLRLLIVAPAEQVADMVKMFSGIVAALEYHMTADVVAGYPEVLALLDFAPGDLAYFPAFCRNESHLL